MRLTITEKDVVEAVGHDIAESTLVGDAAVSHLAASVAREREDILSVTIANRIAKLKVGGFVVDEISIQFEVGANIPGVSLGGKAVALFRRE